MGSKTEKTLCKIKKEGLIKYDPAAFIKLIQPAKFFCKNCGRSAVHEINLCKPAKLPG